MGYEPVGAQAHAWKITEEAFGSVTQRYFT